MPPKKVNAAKKAERKVEKKIQDLAEEVKSQMKKKKQQRRGGGQKSKQMVVAKPMSAYRSYVERYAPTRHERANKMSNAAIVEQFSEDADAYAASLCIPELHLPAKVPDGTMVNTCLVHPEYEASTLASQPLWVHDVAGGYWYWGVGVYPSVVGNIVTISSVGSGTITWGAAQAHPQYSTFSTNFMRVRTVSQSLVVRFEGSVNTMAGECATIRVLNNQLFSSGTSLPTTWQTLTTSVGAEVCAVTQETQGVRLTHFPDDADSGGFNNVTAAGVGNGTALFVVARLSDAQYTAGAFTPGARIYSNFEMAPFQDTQSLFDTSVNLGDPTKVNRAIAQSGGLLSELGSTLSAFEQFVGSPGYLALLRRGAQAVGYLRGLWSGPSGQLTRVTRAFAFANCLSEMSDVFREDEMRYLKSLKVRLRNELDDLEFRSDPRGQMPVVRQTESDEEACLVSPRSSAGTSRRAIPLPRVPLTRG